MRSSILPHASTCLGLLLSVTSCGDSPAQEPVPTLAPTSTPNDTTVPAGSGNVNAGVAPGSSSTPTDPAGVAPVTPAAGDTTNAAPTTTADPNPTQGSTSDDGTAVVTPTVSPNADPNTVDTTEASATTADTTQPAQSVQPGVDQTDATAVTPQETTAGLSPDPQTSADDSSVSPAADDSSDTTSADINPAPEPDIDQDGKSIATLGESTSSAQDYLRLGEIRILNNNWGSAERGCDTQMRVFANQDRTFGWDFNRGACGGMGSQPDFPQVEFGIHPFGIGNALATSPEFSSTTLLPLQISQITSASVTVDNLNIQLQNQSAWNIVMEFWLSERNPVTDPNPGVYAELMAWWGWQNERWPCDSNGDGFSDYDGARVQAGNKEYTLCHQRDDWADGQWRYYQFRAGDGTDGNISRSFNGTIDIKPFLDYLVNSRGYSQSLWVTRLEVGSEIDDNTSGTVTMSNISFEVNGQSRSAEFLE